jgi:hypothetical protein
MIKTDGIFLESWRPMGGEARPPPRQRTTPEVIRNFINQDVYDFCSIIGLVIGAMLGIVYFVLGCLAASNSDSDAVYKHCGSAVRNVLICDIVFSIVGIGAMIWAGAWIWQNDEDRPRKSGDPKKFIPNYEHSSRPLSFFLFFVYFVLGIVSLVYSIIALTSPDCVKAMSSTDGGAVSASGNMGSPLLAIMTVVYGGSFLVFFLFIMGLWVGLSCGCVTLTVVSRNAR